VLALNSKLSVLVGVVALSFGVAGVAGQTPPSPKWGWFETVDLLPRAFEYRLAGDFNQAGGSVDAPLLVRKQASVLHIMKHQVTAEDYELCVADSFCSTRARQTDADPNLPAVQVSWQDATAYAAWLSAKTEQTWRLPTDEEWAFAAGSRFHDDALLIAASRDPSARWLARYEKEAEQDLLDQRPRPIGAFGVNEFGLLDLSGNVWEWTNTCFVRQSLGPDGKPTGASTVNCGVRVVEGQHRTYVTDFIRDARSGGCAVGKPPSNLGFRLVLEDAPQTILSKLRRLMTDL
jgi:formylglycine-generating enzyme required for sulfatase activity